MKSLCLFVTEAESQAGGQLTRKGEQFANVMAENVMNFLNKNIGLNFENGFDRRVKELMEDLRWKAMKNQKSLPVAVESSLEMFSEALFFCSEQKNVQETLKFLGERIALPVVVADELAREDGLSSFFSKLCEDWIHKEQLPRLLILGVGSHVLEGFFVRHFAEAKSQEMLEHTKTVYKSQEGPLVFMAGFEKTPSAIQFFAD